MCKTQDKEDLSLSYIQALCAYSNIGFDIVKHDGIDSTDADLRKEIIFENGGRFFSQLRVQMKSTSSHSQYKEYDDYFSYQLKVKNYNDLCALCTTPIILCLLILPTDRNEWVNWTEQELMIKGRMFWANFSGEEASCNLDKVTVRIEKKNIINIETLNGLLEKVAKGELN